VRDFEAALYQLQPTSIRVIGSDTISPSSTVLNLGVYIDSDLSMQSHVQRTVASGFAALRQIRSVLRSLPSTALETLVVSLVLTRLDYGNATLAGIPENLLRRLQAVLNASARTIAGLPRSAHITSSPRRSPVYTGFVRPSVSSSRWRRWLIVVYTAQPPPATCPLN